MAIAAAATVRVVLVPASAAPLGTAVLSPKSRVQSIDRGSVVVPTS